MQWRAIAQLALGFLPTLVASAFQSQAGLHVIYTYAGPEPPEQLFDLIKQGKVGGVMLYEDNVSENLPNITARMQSVYSQSQESYAYPLLIMTEHEGGEMSPFPGGQNMTAKQIGQTSTPSKYTNKAVQQTARALNSYGVNFNMGLILGVFREEGDFLDQDERSYSDDPTIVSQCGEDYAAEFFVSTPLIAGAKYFPGMGAAKADDDTNKGPVTIDVDLDTLRNVDMVPFNVTLSVQNVFVSMIMPSWAVYPALDPDLPAGLSPKVLRDELRKGFNYDGIIISDSIEAGALKEFGDDADRAITAMQASADLILASSRDVSQGEKIADAIDKAIKAGKFNEDYLYRSKYAITDLRKLFNDDDYY